MRSLESELRPERVYIDPEAMTHYRRLTGATEPWPREVQAYLDAGKEPPSD